MGQYIIKFPDDLHKKAKLRAVGGRDHIERSHYQGCNRISKERGRLDGRSSQTEEEG